MIATVGLRRGRRARDARDHPRTLRGVPAGAAGSASGVLATVQQVGAALGVAGAGTLFFAALPGDFASAFQLASA
jgi:hypothetical protein